MTILYGGKQVDLFHPAKSTGTQLAAINKTGTVINEGDKVWLNKEEQTASNTLAVRSKTSNLNSYGTVLDLTGNMVFSFDEGISIVNNVVGTRINLPCYCYVRYSHYANLRYGINDSIFTREGRTDSHYSWKENSQDGDYYLGDDYMYRYNNGKTICKIDLTSGETLETYTGSLSSVSGYNFIKLHNKNEFICIYNSIILFTFDDTGALVGRTLGTEKISSTYVAIMGVTLDNKYLICDNSGKLVIIDISDIENPHFLSENEILPDLQLFMNKGSCYYAFNPFNNSLTAIYDDNGSTVIYKIFKYENGEFKALNVDFGNNVPMGPITLSKDLSKAAFVNRDSTGQTIVVDLKTNSGYSCLPYKFHNISENTITGYAANTAGLNEQVKVRTVTE